MKILVVHQHYLAPGQPGGSRFNEFARLWSEAGHDVVVVAGTVNYATGETPEQYRERWVTEETDGRVRVLRCRVPESYSKSYSGRMWAFLAFTFSAALGVFVAGRADVIVATSPPLITALPGLVASRIWGAKVPWLFEVRDLWPESAITTGIISERGALARVLYLLERVAYATCDRVNVLTPAFRENILARGLAPAEKIVFIPNGADLSLFGPGPRDNALRRELGWGDRTVVLYAGAHGRANALSQLIEAAERLRDRRDVLIATVGDGPEREALQCSARERALSNIVFLGPRPKEQMRALVNACDVGAAVLQDNPTFRTVYPNKVFDYMACERPVLLAIDGVARKMVCEEAKAGLFAQPEDPDAIASAIRTLADDAELRRSLGVSGRRWVLENSSRERLAERYAEVFAELVDA